jgi:hypothetical protein
MPHFYKLLLQFYRPFWWYHLLFSVIALVFLIIFGLPALILSLLCKLFGYASVVFFRHYFSSYVYDYYRNAGQGIVKLYTITFTADLLTFIAISFICIYLSPVFHA